MALTTLMALITLMCHTHPDPSEQSNLPTLHNLDTPAKTYKKTTKRLRTTTTTRDRKRSRMFSHMLITLALYTSNHDYAMASAPLSHYSIPPLHTTLKPPASPSKHHIYIIATCESPTTNYPGHPTPVPLDHSTHQNNHTHIPPIPTQTATHPHVHILLERPSLPTISLTIPNPCSKHALLHHIKNQTPGPLSFLSTRN
jgi:hypothetical protein